MILENGRSTSVSISDASGVGEVRRAASTYASRLGFGQVEREHVAIVATEAASNVVKHAQRGEVVLRPIARGGAVGLELLVLDKGPGMSDVARCMTDGFSTGGSPGTGLGAISRLSATLEIHSVVGTGTALLAQVWSAEPDEDASVGAGAVCLPKHGEEMCGDAWILAEGDGRAVLMIADGLGHGPMAAEAANAALAVFRKEAARSPAEIVGAAHGALRSTRGAAVAVAEVDFVSRSVRYAGVGNISGAVVTLEATRQMVSHNGTIGHDARRIQEFTYPFPASARLVMHSDGLATHWRMDRYPGLLQRHPSLVAGILYRDFTRGRDDVTVAVLAERRGAA
jgi:anti-sigma regulatory factor (Ser/Thr protein kinase)